MQQRQPRLGDILDDYCPRERRLTNHAVVAMVGDEIKQTRCTTCDAEHEYKHARVPRPRKKDTPAALQAQVMASAPRRVVAEPPRPANAAPESPETAEPHVIDQPRVRPFPSGSFGEPEERLELEGSNGNGFSADSDSVGREAMDGEGMDREAVDREGMDREVGNDADDDRQPVPEAEGPAHRRLIRATLPRLEGTPPVARPAPDFTIRQPTGGRPNRFRARQPQQTRGQGFQGNRSSGQPGGQPGGPSRGGGRGFGQNRPGQRSPHHHGGQNRKGPK